MNFIEMYLAEKASLWEIEHFIDLWNVGLSDLTLHEFIGLTQEELNRYYEDPNSLAGIVEKYK
jgi:helix-turn-helix protein